MLAMRLRAREAVVNTVAMHMWALLLCGRSATVHGRIGAAADGRAAARWRPLRHRYHADGGGGGLAAPPPWVTVVVVV